MLKRRTAVSEIYIERKEEQIESGREKHICSPGGIKESIISWEILIECVKAKYLCANQIKTIFGQTQEIVHCNINLAIVEKKKENFNDERLVKQERLNSYEEIRGEKTSILLKDIFVSRNNRTLKRQLILGRAGIGKSTMSQYLAYHWAKEGWWKEELVNLLIWVPLRQLMNKRIYSEESISLGKIVYEQYSEQLEQAVFIDKEKCIKVLDNLISEHRAEILYVLDGFDEVVSICQLNDGQAAYQTEILRSLLNQERVVITSRPYCIDNYLTSQRIKIDRCLENVGLFSKNIQEYIQRYPWKTLSQQKAFQFSLNNNSLMRGIAHIPLNLVLLCYHWCAHQEIKAFDFSMTYLYEKLVGDFLCKLFEKSSDKSGMAEEDEILENEMVQPILVFLEKLAFLQMQENTLLIGQTQMTELLESLGMSKETEEFKKLLDTGLLVSLDEKNKTSKKRECILLFI